nr:MAG: ORF1 [Torque teno midi virus]
MPFWWPRRNKFWARNRYRRRRRFTFRNKRRTYRRRKPRRPARRRRRRRRRRAKVRRKAQKITVKQWQPESILRCKIKGHGVLVLGTECRQMRCYTNVRNDTVAPRTPSGGGFGVETYNLDYLYSEYQFHNNYWTKSNLYKDLCTYMGVKIVFYRHYNTDFIVSYDRQPPFKLTKASYMGTHPQQMLLQRHHKIILSRATKPTGKITKKMFIKPPKQMIQKWFFSDSFYQYPLCSIKATAANFNSSYQQCCNENQQLGILCLNTLFYQDGNWGNSASAYKPYKTLSGTSKTYYIKYIDGKQDTVTVKWTDYNTSISYTDGWFQSKLLKAASFWNSSYNAQEQAAKPINTAIYNPNLDSGKDSAVWITSILNESYNPPTTDPDVIITGAPLWLCLWGYFDYINELKKPEKDYMATHIVVIKSPALFYFSEPGQTNKRVIPIDTSFVNGQSFFDQPPTYHDRKSWFPTYKNQQKILNAIAESGPFVPKYSGIKESVWELKYFYCFYFKWGGPQMSDPEVVNPKDQGHYTGPYTVQQAVQITHPGKQDPKSLIHSWDYRRGFIKETAIQRMLNNLPSQSTIYSATEEEEQKTPKRKKPQLQTQTYKKRKILQSLHSLCEESTFQETPQTSIQDLIKQQHQQQQQLKRDIIQLLIEMKSKQQMLQLQTGLLD